MKRSAMGHTKLKKLAKRLTLPGYAAVGLLECLWHLTAREAPRGDIGRLTDEDICVGLDWEGDESVLIDALVQTRWIDRSDMHRLVIHDWHDHADDATKKAIARNGQTFASTEVQSPDLSGNVATNTEISRLPEPEPEPKPISPISPKGELDRAKKFDPLNVKLPPNMDSQPGREAWESWIRHLRQKHKPPTQEAVKRQLVSLSKYANPTDALDYSIEMGYQGVFERPASRNGVTRGGKETVEEVFERLSA